MKIEGNCKEENEEIDTKIIEKVNGKSHSFKVILPTINNCILKEGLSIWSKKIFIFML